MKFERTSMIEYHEITRFLALGLSDRQIAKALRCRRSKVAAIRQGALKPEMLQAPKKLNSPPWALQIHWEAVEEEVKQGFEIKRIWEVYAAQLTSASNFYKHLKQRYPLLLQATVTLREFSPGTHAEVDYAGDKIAWIDPSGNIHYASVFVGVLCFSQFVFAWAAPDEKKANWLLAHRRMYEAFRGVPQVTVCDQLKNGVLKSYRYDPELNPDYAELARHYGTAIVPARVRHPKDKALVELHVKLIQRLLGFTYRRHTFFSLDEINQALKRVTDTINNKIHSRFQISRRERLEKQEQLHLKTLPQAPFEDCEWDQLLVHSDCTVRIKGNYYSAPHLYRGTSLRVKTTAFSVELFLQGERVAYHQKVRGKVGERVIDNSHLPENSRSYREMTPQKLLCQSRFIHFELHQLLEELFTFNALGYIRKAEGLIRSANKINHQYGKEIAAPWITTAIENMRRFKRYRVEEFENWVKHEVIKNSSQENRAIIRLPGNPMIRKMENPEQNLNCQST